MRAAGRAVVVVACLAGAACETVPLVREPAPTRLPAEAVQGEIMAFADSYTAIISQASDQATALAPERRAEIHDAKLRNVQHVIIVAADANPIAALLDLTVMVTLQRQAVEDSWIPGQPGEAGRPLLDGLRMLEEDIWQIARRSLGAEEIEALETLIPEIRERFEGGVLVSSIRASDFAEDRRAAVAKLKGGGSLLTLFRLDPLAGLSPAAQELAQSRLLAERAFFWAKRLPLILNWQLQDLILEGLAEPETQRMLEATARLTETSARFTDAVEALREWLPEERAAALDQMRELATAEREAAFAQLAALTAAEREAALKHAFEGLAAEREAIVRTLEQEDARLRGLLGDLRLTIESSTQLSEALTRTMQSTERMGASFRSDGPPEEPRDPEGRPFDILDYKATAEATTATAAELNRAIASLTELVASPAWEERNAQLAKATDRAQASLEQLIDRGFRRGLVLVAVLIVGALLAAVIYRLLAARLIAPRAGG